MEQWKPNAGPQTRALQLKVFELLYGGARGGGKTDAGLAWMLKPISNPLYRGLVIRKNADDLSDWIDRATRRYRKYGPYITGKPPTIRFPSGARIKLGHLKDDQAYTKYQGHEYQRILIEELTQIPFEKNYKQLLGSCRSTVTGLDPRIFITTNPGGVGHGWVKKRFIDPAPWNRVFRGIDTQRTRAFIPSKVEDTPQLVENDPGYLLYLDGLKHTDVELWKAWRLGDWNTFAGQFFREWNPMLHVLPRAYKPFNQAFIIGGMDWGRAAPFCFLFSVVLPMNYEGISFYRVVTFNEVYGTNRNPGEWSKIIKDKGVPIEAIKWVQCDTQIFTKGNDNSISIAEQFYEEDQDWRGVLQPASKDRVGGWVNMHNWLSLAPDGLPYWMVTPNCTNLIRTLPDLVHDEDNVEDVNTDGEDHAPDAARYMLKKLKFIDVRLKLGMVRVARSFSQKKPTPQTADPFLDLDAFENAKQTQFYRQ